MSAVNMQEVRGTVADLTADYLSIQPPTGKTLFLGLEVPPPSTDFIGQEVIVTYDDNIHVVNRIMTPDGVVLYDRDSLLAQQTPQPVPSQPSNVIQPETHLQSPPQPQLQMVQQVQEVQQVQTPGQPQSVPTPSPVQQPQYSHPVQQPIQPVPQMQHQTQNVIEQSAYDSANPQAYSGSRYPDGSPEAKLEAMITEAFNNNQSSLVFIGMNMLRAMSQQDAGENEKQTLLSAFFILRRRLYGYNNSSGSGQGGRNQNNYSRRGNGGNRGYGNRGGRSGGNRGYGRGRGGNRGGWNNY